ncbi:hypothetical protein BpHYR1_007544 [Brachionus plicatilis]|uniref:Uncharacterized protein n=1 Tax=Brachionus plicatilis TaxID=10195 RepID=A0A3M7S1P5_BRAPC|nr:hypothetical protein BpHYR1_007544 [Brachionus plicatilis]
MYHAALRGALDDEFEVRLHAYLGVWLCSAAGQSHENRQQEQIHVPIKLVGYVAKSWDNHGKVIAIGLHKIVPGYSSRVNVVFTEVSEQIFAYQEHVHRAVGIGGPVHYAAKKIGCQNTANLAIKKFS